VIGTIYLARGSICLDNANVLLIVNRLTSFFRKS